MGLLDLFRTKPRREPALTVAMPLLAHGAPIDVDGMRRALEGLTGSPKFGRVDERDGAFSVELRRGGFCVGTVIPAPIPRGELALPAQRAWHWPQAQEAVSAHAAHVIASAAATSGEKAESALALTAFVAALLRTTPGAVGAYWGDAGLLMSKEYFLTFAGGASEENLPTPLWLNLLPLAHGRGLVTHGMGAFGMMELEFEGWDASAEELADRAYSFSTYLLNAGPVIADGDTVGFSADEKITVRHGASSVDPSKQVYRFLPPA